MQQQVTQNGKRKLYRVGKFGLDNGSDLPYESEPGEMGWHITAWQGRDPIRAYWVSGKEFYSMRIHYPYNVTGRTLIEIVAAIADLNSEEGLP